MDERVRAAQHLLETPFDHTQPSAVGERSVELARCVLELLDAQRSTKDTEQAQVLSRMMADPRGQVFTTLLADRAYRSKSSRRTVEQARYLLERLGAPAYLKAIDKLSLSALRRLGSWVPSLSGTAMLNHIRQETSGFILPAAAGELESYLQSRRAQGIDVNVNHLGEEVLGEAEAQARVEGYIALLARPGVETISVKISSICSQLQAMAFEANVTLIADRLRPIYRAAIAHPKSNGKPKLVTLDMEAYRDLELTLAAYMRVLDEPEFSTLGAGIVLQAYLPDAALRQEEVLAWARSRVQRGGSPIRIRVVKGANLAMERVESSIKGWRLPIYDTKAEVDANYKRMLLTACEPENAKAAQLGIASHNLFDLCFGLVLSHARSVSSHVSFELLEGMANPLVLALASLGARVLVYAPIVQAHEFPSAIAYLTRRLDENTSAENYLAHSFDMQFDTPTWHTQRALFLRACGQAETVSKRARRIQDLHQPAIALGEDTPFRNEADTDFGLAHNRRHVDEWLQRTFESTFRVASSFGQAGKNSAELQNGFDPSRPGHVPYAIALADEGVIEECLARAVTAAFHNPHDAAAREAWLRRVAQSLRRSRGELIALMVLDAGKRVEEADVEVSEAIDFAEYYLRCHRELRGDAALARTPHGVVVVTPPWNFPLAIGIGGVLAALVAGNAVILKPPMETPLVQQRACELLWESGVPEDLLQFVVCRDEVGSKLIKDPRTECVVLTGSTNTARLFRDMRPDFHLFAETGGKNALIVSAMSDREQAIADIVASAFGHAGQKCSALSQLILEREVYEDAGFLKQLKDATESLNVGSAWDKTSVITPLIQEPSPQQLRALTTLDEGERWLVQPRFDAANPRLVSPGIKLGVTVGSFSHLTEFFCPLLSVLVAKDLAAAVRIANATPYGLTAGLHSLDEREHEYFIDQIQAGNVYINRRITGAIVQRQPFGGWKASSFGPGAKAGGPNYVAQFVELAHPVTTPSSAPPGQGRAETSPLGTTHAPASTPRRSAPSLELALPTDVDRLLHQMSNTVDVLELQPIADEFLRLHTRWYASPHDDVELLGEDNLLCYKPLAKLLVIADLEMSARDLALIALAATTARCPFAICAYPQSPAAQLAHDIGATQLPSDEAGQLSALFAVVGQTAAPRVRCKTPLPAAVLSVAHERDLHVVNSAVTVSRFELLNGLREQSVTVSYHRHGHTGLRGLAHRNEAPPSSSRRADGPG